MNIVVTGGAGFLGSRVIRSLLQAQDAGRLPVPVDSVVSLDLAPCPVEDPRVSSRVGDMADPAVLADAIRRRPGAVAEAVELQRPAAVRRLVDLGFDVHGSGTGSTPLHQAAYAGDLAMCKLLVGLGADPTREDPAHRSTPIGSAEHAHADGVADFLRQQASDPSDAVRPPDEAEDGHRVGRPGGG